MISSDDAILYKTHKGRVEIRQKKLSLIELKGIIFQETGLQMKNVRVLNEWLTYRCEKTKEEVWVRYRDSKDFNDSKHQIIFQHKSLARVSSTGLLEDSIEYLTVGDVIDELRRIFK